MAFATVWWSGALPETAVTARSSTSGLASASMIAMASSWPGSQSMRMGTGIGRAVCPGDWLACRRMRVTIIGAGGFRTPLTYRALLEARARLGLSEVVLHDSDTARLGTIEAVLAGIDAEGGVSLPRRHETDLAAAVRGAAFVLCAIRVGGLEGRIVDEAVPLAHGVLGQETVGPGGIAFALRTLGPMRDI